MGFLLLPSTKHLHGTLENLHVVPFSAVSLQLLPIVNRKVTTLVCSECSPMFSLAPRLFPQHYNFCSDNNFHFIRSAYAREVAPKSSSGEKLMTKVEGNLAEPALGDLNVKPASLFWVCVCFSKAFMSCLVKNTAWLCCVLCYVQNEMFYIYFFLFTFSCVVILLWILHDNISVYGKMCEINHNCFHIKCIKGKYLCLNALSCILTCYMSVFISPCIY